jgi:aspartyl-tRNA(Asn)/glutamyl-tRNA(Gln) amidotransferase subunit A
MGRIADKASAAIEKVAALGEMKGRIFTEFDPERILAGAAEAERLAASDASLPLAGLLVSVKDLYDEAGLRTTAGSRLLAERAPAAEDCEVVRRMKAAGAVMFGRTTMSEFAYSGVGLNPHYGTPGSRYDDGVVPGGSTSGGALTVALGICDIALGTDTGGSVRIPAAVNGIHGFKPTQSAVPLSGVHPLSQTFDSAGPLAADLATTIAAYEVMSGASRPAAFAQNKPRLRLAIPAGAFTDDLDAKVSADWNAALAALRKTDHELVELDVEYFSQAQRMIGMIIGTEAHAQYSPHFAALESLGDPNVLRRIRFAENLSKPDVEMAHKARKALVARFAEAMAGFDALVAPTLRINPPRIADVEADFDRLNLSMLRNTAMINAADGCAITIPAPSRAGRFPAAIMLANAGGRDWDVLRAAETLAGVF